LGKILGGHCEISSTVVNSCVCHENVKHSITFGGFVNCPSMIRGISDISHNTDRCCARRLTVKAHYTITFTSKSLNDR
jgi:hypothetical protein